MPIEIRELHIKLKINEPDSAATSAPVSNARKMEAENSEDAIVAECVEQTLLALQQKNER